jgi:hypothetical protein
MLDVSQSLAARLKHTWRIEWSAREEKRPALVFLTFDGQFLQKTYIS